MNDCIHPQIKSDISIIVRDSDIKQTVDIRCAKKSARYALYELKKLMVWTFFSRLEIGGSKSL